MNVISLNFKSNSENKIITINEKDYHRLDQFDAPDAINQSGNFYTLGSCNAFFWSSDSPWGFKVLTKGEYGKRRIYRTMYNPKRLKTYRLHSVPSQIIWHAHRLLNEHQLGPEVGDFISFNNDAFFGFQIKKVTGVKASALIRDELITESHLSPKRETAAKLLDNLLLLNVDEEKKAGFKELFPHNFLVDLENGLINYVDLDVRNIKGISDVNELLSQIEKND